MNKWIKWSSGWTILGILSMVVVFGGCEGSDTREKVDKTVEEMAGKKDLERYKKMKDDIKNIQKQQEDQRRQMDPDR